MIPLSKKGIKLREDIRYDRMGIIQKSARKVWRGEFKSLVLNAVNYLQGEAKYRTLGRRDLARLEEVEPALATGISKAISTHIDHRDHKTVNKIEAIRQRLNSSNEEVTLEYNVNNREGLDVEIGNHIEDEIDLAEASKSHPLFCLLLYHIVREIQADQCLELGTSVGISGAYQATGIRHHGGELMTIEGAPDIAQTAEQHFDELDINNVTVVNGLFQEVFEEALDGRMFDFVYVDANHTYDATLQYFDWIYPHLESGAVVVFDDIYWSDGMERAWEKLRMDDRISIAIDTGWHGICVVKKTPQNQFYEVPIKHKTIIR